MKSLVLAHTLGLTLAIVISATGCSSVAPPASSAGSANAPGSAVPAPAAPSDQHAPAPASLAVERQWLQTWFKGTPVVIAQTSVNTLNIDVPREFCFDATQTKVKPPLVAVLDKLSESLVRVPSARVAVLAVPEDKGNAKSLAQERGDQIRMRLVSRGVPAARIGASTTATTSGVQLRITTAPL
jgi:outer membrane protein OmpA-like peptidoglycan-associated protein